MKSLQRSRHEQFVSRVNSRIRIITYGVSPTISTCLQRTGTPTVVRSWTVDRSIGGSSMTRQTNCTSRYPGRQQRSFPSSSAGYTCPSTLCGFVISARCTHHPTLLHAYAYYAYYTQVPLDDDNWPDVRAFLLPARHDHPARDVVRAGRQGLPLLRVYCRPNRAHRKTGATRSTPYIYIYIYTGSIYTVLGVYVLEYSYRNNVNRNTPLEAWRYVVARQRQKGGGGCCANFEFHHSYKVTTNILFVPAATYRSKACMTS